MNKALERQGLTLVEGEDWKQINGHPCYFVSNTGRVLSLKGRHPRLLSSSHPSHRYKSIVVSEKDKQTGRQVHELVLTHFRGERPSPKFTASHVDGDRSNNNISNLVWESHKENIGRNRDHGRMPMGSKHGNAKLTEEDVRKIRKIYSTGATLLRLAQKFNVSTSTVCSITNNKTWRQVA